MTPSAPTMSSTKPRSTSSRSQQTATAKQPLIKTNRTTDQEIPKQTIPPSITDKCILPQDTMEPTHSTRNSNNRKRPLRGMTEGTTTPIKLDLTKVIHDPEHYMFKINLGTKGSIAALCYLPTKFATVIELYHTEVPLKWRHLGIGDLLVQRAFEWVEQSNLLVIPSCPFVLRYIKLHYPDRNNAFWKKIVNEETGLDSRI